MHLVSRVWAFTAALYSLACESKFFQPRGEKVLSSTNGPMTRAPLSLKSQARAACPAVSAAPSLPAAQSSAWGSSPTHQHVLQLDVAVHEPLAVQEADPLHHVQCDLQTRLQGQPGLGDKRTRWSLMRQRLSPTCSAPLRGPPWGAESALGYTGRKSRKRKWKQLGGGEETHERTSSLGQTDPVKAALRPAGQSPGVTGDVTKRLQA